MGRTLLSVASDPVADLKRRLGRAPNDKRMRGMIEMWWLDHGLGDHPAAVGKRIALALIAQRALEAKRAGIHVFAEQLGEQLRATDLPSFAKLYIEGHLDDLPLADAFATRVLGALLDRYATERDRELGRIPVARALFDWRNSDRAIQRRAACFGLARLAHDPAYQPSCFELCATIVWSHEAIDQLGVAELLVTLAAHAPIRSEAFVRRYARFMSRAAIARAISPFANELRRDLLAEWKRATTIRR